MVYGVLWTKLIDKLGSVDAARAYAREQRAHRMRDPMKRARAKACRDKTHKPRSLRSQLVHNARARARKIGMPATVRVTDILWPTHCPVLGVELDYATPRGQRDARNPALPSLDRWDNSQGYVPGNVFVISMRANTLKSNGTPEELMRVAIYAKDGQPWA